MADTDISQVREQTEVQSAEEGHLPDEVRFEEGFSAKTVVGALFVGFIMLPGALYLGLIAGTSLGSAAEWVTILLFAETMRRSFLPMKRQEIYILFYIAASLTGLDTSKGLSGGQFAGLIWNQYFVQSPNAAFVSRQIPHWVVPPAGSPALLHRTFFDHAWLIPIVLMLVCDLLGRVNNLCAGYFLFRVTSDLERLPFPMAPIAASGATALAEAASKEESWRWRVFSVGTVIGLVFSVFYIAVPVFTGVVFGKAWTLLPIPFLDLTRNTESLLPGAVSGLSCDLGGVLVGFVIPYPIVVGSFWGCILTRVGMAPILYHFGMFGNSDNSGWTPGMNGIYTKQITDIKFWMAIGIGLQLAVAAIGIWMVIRSLVKVRNTARNRGMRQPLPPGRGDLPLWMPIVIWFTVTVTFLCICDALLHVDSTPTENHAIFPVWLLVFYGLIWSPVQSYVSARMVGITGTGVSFPYMQQVSIMKSGYPYVDIWYMPIPLVDYGGTAQKFREIELTGTKFGSVVKAEALAWPVLTVGSFIFWAFFWHTTQIPSAQTPFAATMWPIAATFQAMFNTINRKVGALSWVKEAINYPRIGIGFAAGLALYAGFAFFHLPELMFYGFIGGTGNSPPFVIPTMFGAWMGKRYFETRFGVTSWRMYAPVLMAGFACGTGLIAMAAIGLALIAKSVNYLPF